MFSIENEDLTQWLENLENTSQKYIYEKREKWFETTLEKHDIENSFTSLVKLIKSGRYYTLRSNIPMILGKPSLKIYDESENLLALEDLKEDMPVISILEIQGIKCSPRGFQIEIEIKQLLVLNPPDIFQKCILIPNAAHKPKESPPIAAITLKEPMKEEEKEPMKEEENNVTVEPSSSSIEVPSPEIIHEESAEEEYHENETEPEPEIEDDVEVSTGETTDAFTENPDLTEIDFNLEEIPVEESLVLKKRNDVYYEMYREALRKAKMAKEMAVSSYLEAKRIKNLYMLDDLSDDEDDESDFEDGNPVPDGELEN
jgi:hypothetical protein